MTNLEEHLLHAQEELRFADKRITQLSADLALAKSYFNPLTATSVFICGCGYSIPIPVARHITDQATELRQLRALCQEQQRDLASLRQTL